MTIENGYFIVLWLSVLNVLIHQNYHKTHLARFKKTKEPKIHYISCYHYSSRFNILFARLNKIIETNFWRRLNHFNQNKNVNEKEKEKKQIKLNSDSVLNVTLTNRKKYSNFSLFCVWDIKVCVYIHKYIDFLIIPINTSIWTCMFMRIATNL